MADTFLWSDLFRRKKTDREELMEVLGNNILFSTLTKAELSLVASVVYQRTYQPGEIVFHQNARGFGMYIIMSGVVAIKSDSAHGENLVTTLNKGSFFGELALIESNSVRTASAVAEERCVLVGFFKPDLMDLLETKPVIGVKILYALGGVLGQRLLETTDRLGVLTQTRGLAESNDRLL